MEPKTEDIDRALAAEFEYRKRRIAAVDAGRDALTNIEVALSRESDAVVLRETAMEMAREGVALSIENIDNAIVAAASFRKYLGAIRGIQILLVSLVLSNVLTGVITWLILR